MTEANKENDCNGDPCLWLCFPCLFIWAISEKCCQSCCMTCCCIQSSTVDDSKE